MEKKRDRLDRETAEWLQQKEARCGALSRYRSVRYYGSKLSSEASLPHLNNHLFSHTFTPTVMYTSGRKNQNGTGFQACTGPQLGIDSNDI